MNFGVYFFRLVILRVLCWSERKSAWDFLLLRSFITFGWFQWNLFLVLWTCHILRFLWSDFYFYLFRLNELFRGGLMEKFMLRGVHSPVRWLIVDKMLRLNWNWPLHLRDRGIMDRFSIIKGKGWSFVYQWLFIDDKLCFFKKIV